MKKRFLTILFFLTLSLTACSAAEPETSRETPVVPPAPPAEGTTTEDPAGEMKPAFGKTLWDAYLQGILPDGTTLDYTGAEAAATNEFALFDVDRDGQEELLLRWTNACMAGMRMDVFGYDNGEVHTELTVFPASAFYSNGTVVEDWSHNQGLAGDSFWPYSIHLYDEKTDTYQAAGSVDAWDRKLVSEGFPADIDKDGDGLIYFLLPADETWHYTGNRPDYPPVDGPEYEIWQNGFLNGAQKLEIRMQKLTEENISALGYPKPEISPSEPLG